MNPTPLNFSTHALEHFATLKSLTPKPSALMSNRELHNIRMLTGYFDFIARLLQKAVKFTIPDNGKMMDGDGITDTKVELLRLPYPIVALEYSAPNLNDAVTEGRMASGKRIALALDLSKLDPADLAEATRLLPAFNKIDITERVAVISIYHTEEMDWEVALGVSIIYREDELVLGRNQLTGKMVKGIPSDTLILGLLLQHESEYTSLQLAVDNDSIDEVISVVNFCAIMNCNNVDTQLLPASEKLNKKRIANGKLPMFDYHVLVLNPTEIAANASKGGNGTHASPRLHLRRGHIRRLTDGRVTWVNAALIGNKEQGVVEKSYKVKI